MRRSADFTTARDKGRRFDGGWFLLWANRRDDTDPARLGVSASRMVGPAVVRVRCKRQLREIYRLHQHTLPPGFDLIISARAAMRGIPFSELEKRFLKIVDRLASESPVAK